MFVRYQFNVLPMSHLYVKIFSRKTPAKLQHLWSLPARRNGILLRTPHENWHSRPRIFEGCPIQCRVITQAQIPWPNSHLLKEKLHGKLVEWPEPKWKKQHEHAMCISLTSGFQDASGLWLLSLRKKACISNFPICSNWRKPWCWRPIWTTNLSTLDHVNWRKFHVLIHDCMISTGDIQQDTPPIRSQAIRGEDMASSTVSFL